MSALHGKRDTRCEIDLKRLLGACADRRHPQRNDTLWASWAVTSAKGDQRVWFGGDTGYKSGELFGQT